MTAGSLTIVQQLLNAEPGCAHRHFLKDEAIIDETFPTFRDKLLTAVRRRDRTYVEEILAPQIYIAAGTQISKAAFIKKWNDLSQTSLFWPRVQRILGHHARLMRVTAKITVPAVWFDNRNSQDVQGVIWNKHSQLHSAASADSHMIKFLSDEQVSILEPADHKPIETAWVKIRTRQCNVGYVRATDIFSEYDDSADFDQESGNWKMTWFGASM
jgi:hypothetical protein